MMYVGVLADDGMHLVILDGVDEETYREEDITLALDNHFPCGVSNLQWSVITKERDEEMIVKITRLKVEKDEDIAIEAHLKARTDSERREDSKLALNLRRS